MKYFKKINWKQILIYHAKWQLGFIIIWPSLEFCYTVLELQLAWGLILSNFIGALLFYPIDLLIFNKKKQNETEKSNR